MLADVAAGAVLLAGAGACAGAAVRRHGGRLSRLALAGALALAAYGELGAGAPAWPWIAATACAAAGLAAHVLERYEEVTTLSWLDAVMGASSVAALLVALDAPAEAAVAGGGIAFALPLSRWRPGPALALGAAGLACLAAADALAAVAAPLLAVAAWRAEPRAAPGPVFSRVVLTAILAFALVAMVLLTIGQFTQVADAAVVLAIVTVGAAAVRAARTVIERLHDSQHQALTDSLTGLGNRRYLVDSLEGAISEPTASEEVALLLIDLDGFKELNDTLGHHAGDEVLRQIGPRLSGELRGTDVLARLGGDEFAVVLSPGDEAAASSAGLRLRAALERSFSVRDITVHVDASVGIALWPHHATDALGLLQRADVAMYQAKRMRTGHEVYLPARDRHSRSRLALIGELRGAIATEQLVLYYQPKAQLRNGAVCGVEALVRWDHPVRGLLEPAQFLPLAEQTGLTRRLTGFVLDRALQEIGEHRRNGLDLEVAVNLGPADLLDVGLPDDVARALERRRFGPEHLRLEVSEDVVMADPERTTDVLARLRAVGVNVALDDFGAGRASLGNLKALAVDELKIDRSFVMGMTSDPRDAAIVRSTVDLAHRLGLHVVAEGVESIEAWQALADYTCDEAQGNYLALPMPGDELATWLRARPAQAGV